MLQTMEIARSLFFFLLAGLCEIDGDRSNNHHVLAASVTERQSACTLCIQSCLI